ncbi:MAG: DEAD/DEAH box helicase [Candidatus Thorarchaeota archaeon]
MSISKGEFVHLNNNTDQIYLVVGKIENPLGKTKLSLIPFLSGKTPQTHDCDAVTKTRWVGRIPQQLGLACVVAYDTFNPTSRIGHGAVSVNAIFKPHQFRPLLKFIQDPRERILIADQTGLGKTIEAGYVIAHEILNGRASRILVICPSHLRQKWKDDLGNRFGISARRISGQHLRRYIDKGFPKQFTWIVSIDAARSLKDQIEDFGTEFLDILVIDEIHNAIGRQGLTLRREFCKKLSSISRSVLGLSATPINIEETDLLRIVELLRPGELYEISFKKELLVNGLLNSMYTILSDANWSSQSIDSLNQIVNQLDSLIKDIPIEQQDVFQKIISLVQNLSINSEVSDRLILRGIIVDANSFRSWMTRTTRIEAGENRERVICKKVVPLDDNELSADQGGIVTVSEESLYHDTDILLKEYFSHVHRRQLSSSLYGTRTLIECGVNGYSVWNEDGFEKIKDIDYQEDEDVSRTRLIEKNMSPAGQAKCKEILGKYNLLQVDSKIECLRTLLAELHLDEKITKVLVFTEWRPTMRHLQQEFITTRDIPCFFAWGEQKEYEREKQIQKFKSSKEFSVLFCSDILSEGIDLIEANCVINYDLPYNPQKVEQRIGRVDRIGQESSQVFSYSIVVENSLDDKIHELLLERIKAFERGIGPISAILVGQDAVVKSMSSPEQEILEQEVRAKWNLQNNPSLSVIDTPLDHIQNIIETETKKRLDDLYWLVLLPFLATITGLDNCCISDDVLGLNVRTNTTLRNTVAAFWGVEKREVMSAFYSDDESLVISSDSSIGRKLSITTELYRAISKLLLDNVYNPDDGTLVCHLPENHKLQSDSTYYLIECRLDGNRGIERTLAIFRENNNVFSFENDLNPYYLFNLLLKNDGFFELDSNYSTKLLARTNSINDHFSEWINDAIDRDLQDFRAKEPDNISILRNRIPALEKRLRVAKSPQETMFYKSAIHECKELLEERESHLSNLMTSETHDTGISIRCIMVLQGGNVAR